MKTFPPFLHTFWKMFASLFHYRYLPYYIFVAILTYMIVASWFDWQYNLWVHKNINTKIEILWTADILGFIVGLLLPLLSLCVWLWTRKILYQKIFQLSLYTIALSLLASTFFKALIGRESPPHFHGLKWLPKMATWVDNSSHFNFWILREQVFGGFPSSHATVFFGLTFAFYFCTQKWYLKLGKAPLIVFFCLATFITFWVSFGHHWFSESLAGIVLGYVVGRVVSGRI